MSMSQNGENSLVVNAFEEQKSLNLGWYKNVSQLAELDDRIREDDSVHVGQTQLPNSTLCYVE